MGFQRLGAGSPVVAFLFLFLVLSAELAGATSRFIQPLDGGGTVTVDNASSFSDAWIGSRVLTANRSTQDDCVFSPPDFGGLMQAGDRVCVTDHYIAWFDYTRNDGVPFGPDFGADWDRSGTLAGFWSLDPEFGDFRHYRTGPNGCAWPHNELVPGSASPNQEQNWWDRYAPPTEHSIQVVSDSHRYFFSYYKAKASPNSNFTVEVDGATDDEGGVHYKTSARMTSLDNQVDTSDNDDDNGIESTIDAELEFVCRPTEILSRWSFKPSTTEVTDNMFVYLWVGYAQDIDDTACDVAPGSQWPDVVYGMNLYTLSSHQLIVFYPPWWVPAGSIVEMELGEVCSGSNVDRGPFPTTRSRTVRGSPLARHPTSTRALPAFATPRSTNRMPAPEPTRTPIASTGSASSPGTRPTTGPSASAPHAGPSTIQSNSRPWHRNGIGLSSSSIHRSPMCSMTASRAAMRRPGLGLGDRGGRQQCAAGGFEMRNSNVPPGRAEPMSF